MPALGLGYVPEHRDIFPGLTVRQNLLLGIKDSAVPANGGWRHAGDVSNLAARRRYGGWRSSGGEKQMLTICRTLMGDPELDHDRRADRRTGAADRAAGRDLIARIAEAGVAILLVEQKLSIALRISHRVYVMGHGRIVFEGTPDELKANQAVRKEWLEI